MIFHRENFARIREREEKKIAGSCISTGEYRRKYPLPIAFSA
jgi:hypothetical protein